MVHMAKDHQIGGSLPGHAIQGKGQILITPVDRWRLPVPTTGTGGIGSQPRGSAVSHHNQGLIDGNIRSRLHDPISRGLKRHGAVHRLNGFGQVKTTSSTTRTCTNKRQGELRPLDGPPGAVKITKHGKLLLEDAATAVPPTVMVPQDHGHGEGKPRDPARQAKVSIGEIADKENSIGLKDLQELLIRITPGAMQVTSNGKSQVLQSECLGCGHPAPNWS